MARLHVILARGAPLGVVFRRGPSKQVLLIAWNTDTDVFTFGQWFKGRIYERRCDLSPSGDLLLYFAANHRSPGDAWSAISRPPFWTALALWFQCTTYGGGGLFDSDRIAALDTLSGPKPAEGFVLPPWLEVREFELRQSAAESDAVWHARLTRDGWRNGTERNFFSVREDGMIDRRFRSPDWEKKHPIAREQYSLRLTTTWDRAEYALASGNRLLILDRTEWADWDRNGDLLFASEGTLRRLRFSDGLLQPFEKAQQIADFTGLTFENRAPSPHAKAWPSR
jgi:hypothetical protein